ncbi:hypothetical protein V8F33_002455 [Rhypophila sp. PSN 637]
MPVLRFPHDARELTEGLSQVLTEARHAIVKREVDHTVPETIAVVITIIISMSLVGYWGIVRGGSCAWGRGK